MKGSEKRELWVNENKNEEGEETENNRAVGGRPRASGSKEAGQSSISEEGTGCEAEKRAVQAEQGGPMGTMAAHVFSHENPRVTDKDSAVIQEKGIDIVHVDSSEINAHAHTTDTNSALKETVPKFQQDDHLVTDFSEVEETGVINNKTGGDHMKSVSLEN
nr:hypothetical protein CFP56_41060 [Quercus suber]